MRISDWSSDVCSSDLIGPQTAQQLAGILGKAGTIVWNGPVGVFEFEAFSHGTEVLAKAIAESPAFSIAGGGDTLAALAKDRKSVGSGKSVSVSGDIGGRRNIKQKKKQHKKNR